MIRPTNRSGVLVFLTVLVCGCTSSPKEGEFGYAIDSNGVRWAGVAIQGADPATFEWLEVNGQRVPWGRDSQRGYFRNLPVPESDGTTFQAFLEDESLAKDKNHVYHGRRNIERTQWFSNAKAEWRKNMTQPGRSIKIIPEADAASFRFREGNWFEDERHLFRGGKPLKHIDPVTFRRIEVASRTSASWYVDAKHVFRRDTLLEHADPKSFRVDSKTGDTMDDSFVYYGLSRYEAVIDGITRPAKSSSWRIIGNEFYRTDGRLVFLRRGPVLMGADPLTFSVLSNGYSKDASHVWLGENLVPDVDAKSFRVDRDGKAFDRSGPVSLGNPLR